MDRSKKICFIFPYPLQQAPSQRYRFEQYLEFLSAEGFDVKTAPFFNKQVWDILYHKGDRLKKLLGTFTGYFNRLLLLWTLREYHWIYIHREALPFGPPVYEWTLAKLLKKKIIFDFDDAIWIRQTSLSHSWIDRIKSSKKIAGICKLSYRISAGNTYLADFAKSYTKNVTVIPTTIDLGYHSTIKSHQRKQQVVIGWTGTHSTLPYLETVMDPLRKIEEKYQVKILIIANQYPDLDLPEMQFREWKIDTEIEDLLEIDIGLMPLPRTEWTKGKCGLKALQYMALGIPALVTPVGVNKKLVEHGINGFHCQTETDWYTYMEQLILNPKLRLNMGKHGRSRVETCYSVTANKSKFISLFTD